MITRAFQVMLSFLAMVSLAVPAAELLIDSCDSTAVWQVGGGGAVAATTRSGFGSAIKILMPQIAIGGELPFVDRGLNIGTFIPVGSTVNYQGIRFWVKGDGSTKWGNVDLIYGPSYFRFAAQFPITTAWTEVTVPWREFTQRFFDGNLESHVKDVHRIRFTNESNRFPGHPYQAVPPMSYEIDDIRMVDGLALASTPIPSGTSVQNTVAKLRAKQPVKIVVMGASIAYGVGVPFPATDSWPYKLQERLKATYGYTNIAVLNHSIGGSASYMGGASLGWFSYDVEPVDMLIICDWCYNDLTNAGTRPNAPANIADNYQRVLGMVLRRAKSDVLLVNSGLHCEPGNFDRMDAVCDAIKNAGVGMKVQTADVYGAFKALGQPYLTANYYTIDYVHHNALAHTHASQVIHDAILAGGATQNHAPTANSQIITLVTGAPRAITLTGSDPDGTALTYSIAAAPAHGLLSGAAPNVIYTPAAGYSGADSFTFRVSDGMLTSNVATVSISVTAAAGEPEFPRVYIDTTIVPPTGKSIMVNAGGDLQAAINAALPGDVVSVQAGATFTGTFDLPEKTGSGWVTIRTSAADAALPPGTRTTPAQAPQMPKLITTRDIPALRTSGMAHHYRLIGLEITTTATLTYNLLQLGSSETSASALPHNIIVDRCYIHGHSASNIQNGIAMNARHVALIDSHLDQCHSMMYESHCIGSTNGPGPFKIVNNHLGGSTINILLGGAVPQIPNLVPSDIEFRRNLCTRPLAYRPSDPSYAGKNWGVKNLFELKNAQRVLIDGNTFENCWPHEGDLAYAGNGQHGWAILLTVVDEAARAPWTVVQDITLTNNIIRKANCGMQIYGLEGLGAQRIKIQNNLFHDIGTGWGNNDRTGMFVQLQGARHLTFNHNTCYNNAAQANTAFVTTGTVVNVGGFEFINNIVNHGPQGFHGAGTTAGFPTLNTYFSASPSYVFQRNAMMTLTNRSSVYPVLNYFPSTWTAVGFTDVLNKNFRLLASSPYKNQGSDGKDLGCDMDAILAAMGTPPVTDTTKPVISNIVAAPGATSATITWATNELSDTQLEYGLTSTYGSSTAVNTAKVMSHSQGLTGLKASTLYNFRVKSSDAAGNQQISANFTFITTSANRPPVISSPASATPNPAQVNQNIVFSVAATDPDRNALTYSWIFGDGASAAGPSVVHAYTVASAFTAWVTVSDGKGGSVSSSVNVTINSIDAVWVEDSIPNGGVPVAELGSSWIWITSNPAPYSGSQASQSRIAAGVHQYYFYGATQSLNVDAGEKLFAYVYLDPANLPSEIMLQWNDGHWGHRAYWGANNINWGTDGTGSRRYMGPLPSPGRWTRLEVAARDVGLEGRIVNGLAFTLFGGRAAWDHAGKSLSIAGNELAGAINAGAALADMDTDGDGFSDQYESVENTDPFDPLSFTRLPMTITKLQGAFNFAAAGRDACTISGILPDVPAGYEYAGQTLILNVGGAKVNFLLDAHGKGVNGRSSLALKFKTSRRNKITDERNLTGGSVTFTAKLAGGTWSGDWKLDQLQTESNTQNGSVDFVVDLAIHGKVYSATATVSCTRRQLIGGKFRK
jgi:hypothetical protein